MSESLIVNEIEQAAAAVLGSNGYELVLVEYVPRQRLVRVYIDREPGITIDDCSQVSRILGDLFDAEGISDRIPGHYHLEVSSPGLDRPLTKAADFMRFIGHTVQITISAPSEDGRRKFSGELVFADDRVARVLVDGQGHDIPYESITRARLVPDL